MIGEAADVARPFSKPRSNSRLSRGSDGGDRRRMPARTAEAVYRARQRALVYADALVAVAFLARA